MNNVDVHFVVSLGGKVNNNTWRDSIVCTKPGRGIQVDRQCLRAWMRPHLGIYASTRILGRILEFNKITILLSQSCLRGKCQQSVFYFKHGETWTVRKRILRAIPRTLTLRRYYAQLLSTWCQNNNMRGPAGNGNKCFRPVEQYRPVEYQIR